MPIYSFTRLHVYHWYKPMEQLVSVNQSDKQASLRAKTSEEFSYEGDFHAYWDLLGTVPDGPFEGRMLAWINGVLGSSYTNVNAAKQAYAVSKGAYNWDSLGSLGLP